MRHQFRVLWYLYELYATWGIALALSLGWSAGLLPEWLSVAAVPAGFVTWLICLVAIRIALMIPTLVVLVPVMVFVRRRDKKRPTAIGSMQSVSS